MTTIRNVKIEDPVVDTNTFEPYYDVNFRFYFEAQQDGHVSADEQDVAIGLEFLRKIAAAEKEHAEGKVKAAMMAEVAEPQLKAQGLMDLFQLADKDLISKVLAIAKLVNIQEVDEKTIRISIDLVKK